MKTLNFLTRLGICLMILIAIEGICTLGTAFELQSYTWLGCLVQFILLTICVRVSVSKWTENANPNYL
jgi:hypothetical protein